MTKTCKVESDTIFEIHEPTNIGIDTKLMFLSSIVSDILHPKNWYGGHFKWPLSPPQVESGWGPPLKQVIGAYTRHVPNSVIISENANSTWMN